MALSSSSSAAFPFVPPLIHADMTRAVRRRALCRSSYSPPQSSFTLSSPFVSGRVLSFILSARYITEHIVNKSDIARLRRTSSQRLLAREHARRERQGWPLYTDPASAELSHWTTSCIDVWPCYGCLREKPARWFSYQMRSYRRALDQIDAAKRLCMPCSARSGFYRIGSRADRKSVV